jgi:uncharacterized protein (TIGR04255 family)
MTSEEASVMDGKRLGQWKNAPLAYVVADIAISPYMTIAKHVPAFQERLRPNFPRTLESVTLRADSSQAQASVAPALLPEQVWHFIASPPQIGIALSTRSISLHVTTYSDYEEFESNLAMILAAFSDTVPNAFVERIGLRFIDLIVPSRGKKIRDYLDPSLHGFVPQGAVSETQTIVGTSHRFKEGAMNISLHVKLPSGSNFPANIALLPLAPAEIVNRSISNSMIQSELGCIDIDRYVEPRTRFDANAILQSLRLMHRDQSNAFKAMISKLATKEWE